MDKIILSSKLYRSCVHFTAALDPLHILFLDAIGRFYSIPNRAIGACYSSAFFAIGEFGPSGGELTLSNCDSVRLVIPRHALSSTQLVYMMMTFDNNDDNDSTANYSPTFECGPDGLEFNVGFVES